MANILPDAEVETTDTVYEDWLAAQGLLGLKSSLVAEVDPKILTRKTSLDNLYWSLDVTHKFINMNEFSYAKMQEVGIKLGEIMDLIRSKVVPETSVIHKVADKEELKKEIDKAVKKRKKKLVLLIK